MRNTLHSINNAPLAAVGDVKTEAISRMTELRDQGVAAFVGPDQNCKDEALVAAAWNLPIIAFVSGAHYETQTTG